MDKNDFFKPYEGDEPYIFISYAHADSAAVMEIIGDMHARGFHIWYDEGIEAGSEWTECIASHLASAELMLGFVTDSYIASDNCRREMNYAVQKKKKVINIFLSPTTLTPGMELQIGGIWALMKYSYPSEEYFYQKLYEAPALNSANFGADAAAIAAEPVKAPKKPKKAPVVVEAKVRAPEDKKRRLRQFITLLSAAVVIAVVVLSIVGSRLGFFDRLYNKTLAKPAEVVALADDAAAEFKSPVLEAAAREYCGKSSGELFVGDLKGLTTLVVCGGEYSFDPASPVSSAAAEMELLQTESEYTASDGGIYARGEIRDLSDIACFPDLQSLTLAFQTLNSLETLPSTGLHSLKLRCNRLTGLEGIQNAPLLEELNVSGNHISDIAALSACIYLRELNLSDNSVRDFSALQGMTELASFSASDATAGELRDVLLLDGLTNVRLTDCDLRGDFFDDLDSKRLMYLELNACLVDGTRRIERLSGLAELRLVGCTGVSDWSALSDCPALRRVVADAAQKDFFPDERPYELIIE